MTKLPKFFKKFADKLFKKKVPHILISLVDGKVCISTYANRENLNILCLNLEKVLTKLDKELPDDAPK